MKKNIQEEYLWQMQERAKTQGIPQSIGPQKKEQIFSLQPVLAHQAITEDVL